MDISLENVAEGLNSISWDILSILNKNEEISYMEIKNKLKISQEKANREIARLEGARLVKTYKDDINARVKKFRLSEYGLEILKIKNKGE